ncbi:hypothetical protein CcaverHIS002_0403830 [Cutaneotrichosporon cavernicola]|uniref:Uncharacterized protein n=1 Tax=Cutaneotrichosporon cavernicola TaxID=279322 RepID=A0AA48L426_9TREE|nr:uncharacterized protein CcaverHIS019_0403780 [Cutaneotrichosporon cavernicola]BEI83779.1 hypothetical protein CcaverHIS002_0403830 [Cutaneotrichosporon cavernicola]BEI91558.1 hypothetical protein CcaverHIS019_0403780 [Cutaneotrichosporon cavernicola]BEI99335.1 hypothetical protein CcaverHIS631_0403780 [Cutaneotrichosporon cavernicola]BEJ07110.1 hypothetical protein CcaverHIS641_0403790 [Cutaneotrichosporon cavernicola]
MHILAPALLAWTALFGAAEAKSHVKIKLSIPTLVQCEKAILHWKGGNPPFKVWAQEDSRSPDGISPITDSTPNRWAEWTVDAPAGTRVSLRLRDAKGHWVKTYAEVYQGENDDCVNLAYPDPLEEARPPPPKEWKVTRGLEFVALAVVVLLACWGIVRVIGGREKKAEEGRQRGEYIQVQGEEIPMHDTRRRTPPRQQGDGEEFRSLLPSDKRVD